MSHSETHLSGPSPLVTRRPILARLARIIGFRLALGVFTLWIISIVIFAAIEALPGDFARSSLGRSATPEQVAILEHQLGLDQPLVTRYGAWIGGVVQGDFGLSLSSKPNRPRPVTAMIAPRLKNTLILATVAASIAVPLAIGLGVLCALWRGSIFDRTISALTLITISFPEFFLAYLLTYLVISKDIFLHSELAQLLPGWLTQATQTGLEAIPRFPILASVNERTGFWEHMWKISLPATVLGLVIIAHMMRMTRAVLISLLSSQWVEMARLKGLAPTRIVGRHALRNAWGPVATVVALNLAYLIAGVVMVEVVFVYPGIGQLMVDAVKQRDIPVVQACALIFAATYILFNLIADVIAILANPRQLHAR